MQHQKRTTESKLIRYKKLLLEKMRDYNKLKGTYQKKYDLQEKIVEIQLTDMKKKATEV